MRKAQVLENKQLAGYLIENDDRSFVFEYADSYLLDPSKTGISLTLPKRSEKYTSPSIFPFFFNMLSEGSNKATQCKYMRIDENDYFTLLVRTAHSDTIGAITVKEFLLELWSR